MSPTPAQAMEAFRAYVAEHGISPTEKEWADLIGCHRNTVRSLVKTQLIPRGHIIQLRWKNCRRRYAIPVDERAIDPRMKPIIGWCTKVRKMLDKAGIFSAVEELDEILETSAGSVSR